MNTRLQAGKILVPWDFSKQSMFALRSALEIAGGDSPQIRVLHVAAPLSGPDSGVLDGFAAKQKTQELQGKFREQVRGEEFQNVSFHVSYGHVAQEIVRFVEEHKVRLVVIVPHKRKWLSRFWTGGLPERLIQTAKCSVLVVQLDQEHSRCESRRECNQHQNLPAVSYRHGM